MEIGRIQGANAFPGAPENWDEERDGICGVLPIRVEQDEEGYLLMTSSWIPTMDEIRSIIMGAPIHLRIKGMRQHPVVSMYTGPEPS